MAEWSKALVLGTSLFGGVGSNPTAAKYNLFVGSVTSKYVFGASLVSLRLRPEVLPGCQDGRVV